MHPVEPYPKTPAKIRRAGATIVRAISLFLSLGILLAAAPPPGRPARPAPRAAERPPAQGQGPAVGQAAPDVTLLRLEALQNDEVRGKIQRGETVDLSRVTVSDFRGKGPLVLVFASYT